MAASTAAKTTAEGMAVTLAQYFRRPTTVQYPDRTGVPVATLQAMNTGVDLKTATRLVVPNSNVRLTNWRRGQTNNSDAGNQPTLSSVRARKGDTIARIAAARKLSVEEVSRLNGIAPDAELQNGQEIKLPGSTAPAGGNRRR